MERRHSVVSTWRRGVRTLVVRQANKLGYLKRKAISTRGWLSWQQRAAAQSYRHPLALFDFAVLLLDVEAQRLQSADEVEIGPKTEPTERINTGSRGEGVHGQ
jgi:hypothetical protein